MEGARLPRMRAHMLPPGRFVPQRLDNPTASTRLLFRLVLGRALPRPEVEGRNRGAAQDLRDVWQGVPGEPARCGDVLASMSAKSLSQASYEMTAFRRTLHVKPDARTFAVVIVAGAKSGTWGRYSTADQALNVANSLRRHGMDARVFDLRGDEVKAMP